MPQKQPAKPLKPRKAPPPKPPKPPKEEDDDIESEEEEAGPTLEEQFVLFVKHNNIDNPGTHILLSQSDFWMRQAGIIAGRQLTTTDTGICYFKFRKYKLDYNEYLEFLQMLADYKNIQVDEIIEKLVNCGPPLEQPKPKVMAN